MGEFSINVRKFVDKTKEKQGRAVRKIALDAFSEVILRTPVDTGRARGNWQASIGTIPATRLEQFDPGGAATIASTQGVVAGFEPGAVVYLANNLPYIERLENGYSKQAPEGMVRLTAQRFQQIADAVFRQIGAE